MAANPVLWSANDDQHTALGRWQGCRSRRCRPTASNDTVSPVAAAVAPSVRSGERLPWRCDDAYQLLAFAREKHGPFEHTHGDGARRIASRLACNSAWHSLISLVCQKAGPCTTVPRTS